MITDWHQCKILLCFNQNKSDFARIRIIFYYFSTNVETQTVINFDWNKLLTSAQESIKSLLFEYSEAVFETFAFISSCRCTLLEFIVGDVSKRYTWISHLFRWRMGSVSMGIGGPKDITQRNGFLWPLAKSAFQQTLSPSLLSGVTILISKQYFNFSQLTRQLKLIIKRVKCIYKIETNVINEWIILNAIKLAAVIKGKIISKIEIEM